MPGGENLAGKHWSVRQLELRTPLVEALVEDFLCFSLYSFPGVTRPAAVCCFTEEQVFKSEHQTDDIRKGWLFLVSELLQALSGSCAAPNKT